MTKLQCKRRKHVHSRSSINLAHRAECRERRIAVQDCDCLSDRRLLLGAEHVALLELRLLLRAPRAIELAQSCLLISRRNSLKIVATNLSALAPRRKGRAQRGSGKWRSKAEDIQEGNERERGKRNRTCRSTMQGTPGHPQGAAGPCSSPTSCAFFMARIVDASKSLAQQAAHCAVRYAASCYLRSTT